MASYSQMIQSLVERVEILEVEIEKIYELIKKKEDVWTTKKNKRF